MSKAPATGILSTLDVERFLETQAGSTWLTERAWFIRPHSSSRARLGVDLHQIEVCQLPAEKNLPNREKHR